ncbi:MAG: MATE family efflux transporter [Clostridia bacterium]|nr:MATE family efflux transporter [Clostridia bacterium]
MARRALNVTDESNGIVKTIFLLAWPVFLEQIFTTLVGYADTAMVGSLGANATASVSISQSPIMFLNGIVMSLGIGITTLVARSVGAGQPEQVKKLMHHAILLILFVGLPISLLTISLHRAIPRFMGAAPEILDTAAEYNLIVCTGRIFITTSMILNSAFRGYGDTKTPLIGNAMMNIINVVFNFLLIYPTRDIHFLGLSFRMFGAGLEVKGAAIATAIGMTTAGLFSLYVCFFRKGPYTISLTKGWKIDFPLTKQIFTISFPAMLERMFMSMSGILTSRSIASLGTINVAANSLSLTAESMSFMPAFSFQTAIVTLVGQSLGAKKPELAERYVKATSVIGTGVMIFTSIMLFTFSSQIIGFFTPDQSVINLASQCLKVTACLQVPQVLAWILAGVLRGAGDTKINFYITASTQWLVRTLWSILFIRVFHLGLVAIMYVALVEVVIRMLLLFWRYRTGIWKTVIKD